MCGIAGLIDPIRFMGGSLGRTVAAMAEALVHRGPDGRGIWEHSDLPVALGHRRLSILDLSDAAAQPIHSRSGLTTLVFNGEIYNYLELADELSGSGVVIEAGSDTRVLCEALEFWGIEEALQRVDGMFALACWNDSLRQLYLARDRFGEKPLYLGLDGQILRFGSELKALRTDTTFKPSVDLTAIDAVLRTLYIPDSGSVYEEVRQVKPGTIETYDLPSSRFLPVRRYWSPESLLAQPSRIDEMPAAAEGLRQALEISVARRLRSDVPTGCFLSGGIDSSLVTAVAASVSSQPVQTFTAGFEEPEYDESVHGRSVADYLGTEHHSLDVRAADALALVPEMPDVYDEPFADVSQLPTYLISRLAREKVKVVLSGDGGDELFGGYSRYQRLARIEGWRHRLQPVRQPASAMARFVSNIQPVAERAQKFAAVLDSGDLWQLYGLEQSKWYPEGSPVASSGSHWVPWPMRPEQLPVDPTETMMYHDLIGYLPGDILTKVDRASMAVSLETRLPLLSPEVARLGFGVSPMVRHRGGLPKAVMREVLGQFVPNEIIDRPKSGFGVPIAKWLRGPLRPWAEDLLAVDAIGRHGCLDSKQARALWARFQAGEPNLGLPCYAMVSVQAWADRWLVS